MAFPPNQNVPQNMPAYDAMSIAVKGMGAINSGPTGMRPRKYMNTQTLAAVPEGADTIFARPAKLFAGLPVMHFGPRSLATRTPGTPVAVGGLGEYVEAPDYQGVADASPAIPWAGIAIAAGIAYLLLKRK
jgi:hypothetical protein